MHRVQVLVCGAGPVGAVAAYSLAERGIDVCLVEALPTPPEDMRASTLHPPTLDMLDELGLLPLLAAQGLKAPVYQYRNRRSGKVLTFDLGELGDELRHPYRLQCEQFKVARLCASLLADHPHAEVRFRTRLASFSQDERGVTVHLETPNAIESVRADYLIAADGANSIVRKWLGTPFSGFTYPEKFLTLSTTWPMERHFEDLAFVNYMADPEEWCVLLKTPAAWRVLVPADESEADDKLLGDAKKDRIFDRLMGDGAAITTLHRTIYRVHQRVVDRYDHGRVLLAGDAAHLNNPLGGFGMNSGIHDVWNLRDKLTAILKTGAEPGPLLAHYDRQRRTVMNEFVQAQTIKNKSGMESADQQRQQEAELEGILRDEGRRREYLRIQGMVRSLEREAQIE